MNADMCGSLMSYLQEEDIKILLIIQQGNCLLHLKYHNIVLKCFLPTFSIQLAAKFNSCKYFM